MRRLTAIVVLSAFAASAQAQLFADDSARKAILELRQRVSTLELSIAQRDAELAARLDRMEAAQRNQLELVNQMEALRQEIARLRGQIEGLANEIATVQKRQRDLYADLDTRLKQLEPASVTVDGRTGTIDRSEQVAYEAALAQFRASDFRGALASFQQFISRYPQSPYTPVAQYWIGSSHFALKDYRAAIAAHQSLVDLYPDSPRAPDALLSIAESQVQLGDRRNSNETLARILKNYPDSEAGRLARERLPR
jgi:tol-pal system protein YbgF